jgi:uncharacterized protein YegJ (DUF2314 family)
MNRADRLVPSPGEERGDGRPAAAGRGTPLERAAVAGAPGAGPGDVLDPVGQLGGPDPWALPEPFPTSLVAIWPFEEAPVAQEVLAAFARFVGESIGVLEEIPEEDPSIAWNRVVVVPGLPSPVIVWSEPARAMGPDDLPDPSLAKAKWVLGCESVLSEQAPLEDFIALMRLLAGSIAELPAVLDTVTRQWFDRDELESLFLADEPAATEDVLWRIHAVGRSERLEDDDRIWLYTAGLWRCGKPELEILELPGEHASTGITLLGSVAALSLVAPLPRPGTPALIGENLRIAFRPWQEVTAFLDPQSVGSLADRRAGDEPGALNPLTGNRAALCDPEPKGSFRSVWTWPQKAIQLLEDGRGAIYLSERATAQRARAARMTWPEFATAFAAIGRALEELRRDDRSASPISAQPAFLVKAAFVDRLDPARGREHLWFEIRRLAGDEVEAELINTPQLATYLRPGDSVRIARADVTDWRVILPDGGFEPSSAAGLLRAVDRYRAALSGR